MKKTCCERLKEALALSDMTQAELCRSTGISKTAISQYLTGKYLPKQDRLEKLAKALNVSEAWLMGYSVPVQRGVHLAQNILPAPNFYNVPRLGRIACGVPITAEENYEGTDFVPEDIKGVDFSLVCKGDSMIDARINDGDIVYISADSEVENGQIAAVRIGEDATLKRVYFSGNGESATLTLVACNPAYAPMVYTGSQLADVQIIGKAVGFTSIIK